MKGGDGFMIAVEGQRVRVMGDEFSIGSDALSHALFDLCDALPMRDIPVSGHPYMERYAVYVDEEAGEYHYLHRFLSGDGDRHLHSHPWEAASAIILCGGYSEDRYNQTLGRIETHRYAPGDRNELAHDQLHQIRVVQPHTWTLFSHGPWTHRWGFVSGWDGDKPIIQRDHAEGKNRGWWNRNPLGSNHPARQPMPR